MDRAEVLEEVAGDLMGHKITSQHEAAPQL